MKKEDDMRNIHNIFLAPDLSENYLSHFENRNRNFYLVVFASVIKCLKGPLKSF